jgi:hypothetical protein
MTVPQRMLSVSWHYLVLHTTGTTLLHLMEGNIDANQPLALQLAAARAQSSVSTGESQASAATATAAAALRARVRVAELKWGDDSPLLSKTEQPYDLILCSVSTLQTVHEYHV